VPRARAKTMKGIEIDLIISRGLKLQWGKRIPRSETMAEQHFSFPHKSSPRSDPLAFWRVYTPHRCKILKLPPSVALFHFPLSALNSLFAACGAEFLCDSSSRNPLRISLKKQGDCAANCDRSAIPPDLSVERGNLNRLPALALRHHRRARWSKISHRAEGRLPPLCPAAS
jgi:hypothetical protein